MIAHNIDLLRIVRILVYDIIVIDNILKIDYCQLVVLRVNFRFGFSAISRKGSLSRYVCSRFDIGNLWPLITTS